MEKIEIEGKRYIIDTEKCIKQGLLREIPSRPCSWEEYCRKVEDESIPLWDEDGAGGVSDSYNATWWRSTTKEKAKAFAAFGRLLQLRDAWVGDWKPDFKDYTTTDKYVIVSNEERLDVAACHTVSHSLSFPTRKMRDEFMETFKDLLETAKELL